MKLLEFGEQRLDLIDWRQNGRSKVISAWSLQETAAWYHANAGLVDELEAVEHVWLNIQRLKKKSKITFSRRFSWS